MRHFRIFGVVYVDCDVVAVQRRVRLQIDQKFVFVRRIQVRVIYIYFYCDLVDEERSEGRGKGNPTKGRLLFLIVIRGLQCAVQFVQILVRVICEDKKFTWNEKGI